MTEMNKYNSNPPAEGDERLYSTFWMMLNNLSLRVANIEAELTRRDTGPKKKVRTYELEIVRKNKLGSGSREEDSSG